MQFSSAAAEWNHLLAPVTGDIRTDLVLEAAEFLGLSAPDAWDRLRGAGERFRHEWLQSVADERDSETLKRFYNQSDTELFELIEWHASDPIHYRTLIVRDFFGSAAEKRGLQAPTYLDYGSGIGNDALVFAHAGFDVTLADISDVLLAFAGWRCRRRGFRVRAIDLKRTDALPADAYDAVVCFDVLEHIPAPLRVVRAIRAALRTGGLLALHAPFGVDPEHPMHVVHRDVVTPRMRSLGFQPIDCVFPTGIFAPRIYEKQPVPALDRVGYFVYDNYLNNSVGDRLAALYRTLRRRSKLQRPSHPAARFTPGRLARPCRSEVCGRDASRMV